MDSSPEKKVPKPNRCNARLEDFIQALYTFEFRGKIVPAWRNFRLCMKSEPGSEPTVPYLVVTDPEKYLDGERLRRY